MVPSSNKHALPRLLWNVLRPSSPSVNTIPSIFSSYALRNSELSYYLLFFANDKNRIGTFDRRERAPCVGTSLLAQRVRGNWKPMTIAQLLRESEHFELVSTLQREYVQAPYFFFSLTNALISLSSYRYISNCHSFYLFNQCAKLNFISPATSHFFVFVLIPFNSGLYLAQPVGPCVGLSSATTLRTVQRRSDNMAKTKSQKGVLRLRNRCATRPAIS